MKQQTEIALRGILGMDAEVKPADIELAMRVLKGLFVMPKSQPQKIEKLEDLSVMTREQVASALNKHVRSIDYYVRCGYLDNVYGSGSRSIGISRASVLRFIKHRTRRVA